MPAKISRTFLVLLCSLLILLPLQTKGYRQAFATITPETEADFKALESDSADSEENGEEEPETDTSNEKESSEEESEPNTESSEEGGEESLEPNTSNGEEADEEFPKSGLEPMPTPSASPPKESANEPPQEQKIEVASETGTEQNGEQPAGYEGIAAAYGFEANERVVKSFEELKDALNLDNGVTTVHLGKDIIMQDGISISDKKPHITIDGLDPTNPAQSEPYTLTDFNSALFTETIHLNSSSVSYIHVRDLKIVGKNYYGPIGILDADGMSKVKLIFERVEYNGPQLGYHRQGRIHVIDCKVRLHGDNGICPSQEFSEAKELIFEGINTIDTKTTDFSVFWHPFGGSLTVADDSSVILNSPKTSATYGMFYADGAAHDIDITVGRRASFNAEILNSVSSIANVTLSSLNVLEGGSFSVTTTGTANRTVLSIGGNITVEPDAEFKINSFGGIYPALNLRTGNITVEKDAVFHIISQNTNSSLLNLYGRSFICNDPSSILLYNPGDRDILATTTSGKILVDSEQADYWRTASNGGFDDPPLYRWKKTSGANITIEGTLAIGIIGNLSSVSSNYDEGDLPGTPPSKDSFNMVSSRVLAFGRLELMVNAPVTTSTEITGVTKPGAVVRASFYQDGVSYTTSDVIADGNGVFAIPIDISLKKETDITVMSNHQYLTATYTVSVEDAGGLSFTVPDELHFYTTALSPKSKTVKRLNANWSLMVSDTRGAGNTWSVYLRELQPLTPVDSIKPKLENSLVFVKDTGAVMPLSTSGTLLIYKRNAETGGEMANISWPSDRGVLARIPTGAAYSNQLYEGILEWSLIDAP